MLSTPLLSLLAGRMTLMSPRRISCIPPRILNSLKHGTQSKMHAFLHSYPLLVHLLILYYQVYLTDIMGRTQPRELTSGKQGAIHCPVFSKQGDKVAWLELDQDGYESDRAKIVIYDLHKDVRYTLTQHWDRSPSELAVRSPEIFCSLP